MDPINMPLAGATDYADRIAGALQDVAPAAQILIAGSIRRRRMVCHDIDLVILANGRDQEMIKNRCEQNGGAIKADGAINWIYTLKSGVQLDIFFARLPEQQLLEQMPSNWGSLVLCRTGSKDFNIWYATKAREYGLTWDPYKGLFDQDFHILASETEEEMFGAMKLDWIPPELRERELLPQIRWNGKAWVTA